MSFALRFIIILYAAFLGSQSLLVVSSSVGNSTIATYSNYTYAPGIGIYKVHLQPTTWSTARRTCEEEGGHLVIVNSVEEAHIIVQLLHDSNIPSSYLGVHDLYEENEFVTIHGESLARTGFNSWRNGQPDNSNGNENCVMMYIDGLLNDVRCNASMRFICELATA